MDWLAGLDPIPALVVVGCTALLPALTKAFVTVVCVWGTGRRQKQAERAMPFLYPKARPPSPGDTDDAS